jgi:hypothetical protein
MITRTPEYHAACVARSRAIKEARRLAAKLERMEALADDGDIDAPTQDALCAVIDAIAEQHRAAAAALAIMRAADASPLAADERSCANLRRPSY